MERKLLILCITTLFITFSALNVFSGTGYEIKCQNKECNYSDRFNSGGGFLFEQITGYCVSTQKFVYITWDRQGAVKKEDSPRVIKDKPVPAGQVWLPDIGEFRFLYTAPECPEPFLQIQSIEEVKHCPKCNKKTLKIKKTILYD